jgi:hypothetical protein
MREYEDVMMYVQVRHVRVSDESTMRSRKDVQYESRLLRNKFKCSMDMSGSKFNQ